ncbi:MAG: hypothetical protein LBP54_06380 [Campylobacteraceae bacterium]|jgi:hypothetical protein|nr:hypothetical protein [Campylobacteraceae bacterium]
MKNISSHAAILTIVLFFSGCANQQYVQPANVSKIYSLPNVIPASPQYMQPVNLSEADMRLSQNESAIVFLRPTFLGAAVQAPIAEFIDNDLKFVAIVSAKSKVFYKTTPGKHFFVVGGEGSNLLEADFEGGKIYYSYISPHMGFIKARFEFEPVKNGARPDKENKKDPLLAIKKNRR